MDIIGLRILYRVRNFNSKKPLEQVYIFIICKKLTIRNEYWTITQNLETSISSEIFNSLCYIQTVEVIDITIKKQLRNNEYQRFSKFYKTGVLKVKYETNNRMSGDVS